MPRFDAMRLQQLIAEKCNGALSAEDHDELERMLAESVEARAMYCECLSIHADLGWEFAGKTACNHEVARLVLDAGDSARIEARPSRVVARSKLKSWALAVAGCLLVAALIAGLSRSIADRGPVKLAGNAATIVPEVLGTLTPLLPDTRWSFGKSSAHNPSSFVAGETVLLDRGAAQLRLTSNTTAQLEAPVILQMVSLNLARVLRGRITFEVAEGAENFKVETASAEVVDLGTSFSVRVGDRATEVVVFQGKVDLKVASQIFLLCDTDF